MRLLDPITFAKKVRTQTGPFYLGGVSALGLSPAPFLANERTRFTKFQRVFSDDRSPSPGILPFPLLIIQKSSPSVIFSIEETSRQSWSSSFMSTPSSPLPSPLFP